MELDEVAAVAGEVTDLLHPRAHLLVVPAGVTSRPGQVLQEALHALHLFLDELHMSLPTLLSSSASFRRRPRSELTAPDASSAIAAGTDDADQTLPRRPHPLPLTGRLAGVSPLQQRYGR